ncbi:MAG TPA: hypothetical protein VFH59_03915 [Frateuria sp.]|uniref:hypothetical protein n=1 Tax=Frateuria sp. TaxID=2211372 RepID=UPI002D7E6858|nr:hypothetical protein [Frateuria sp.]HET6804572.1 hypothetical protein [Frateuria sp.]
MGVDRLTSHFRSDYACDWQATDARRNVSLSGRIDVPLVMRRNVLDPTFVPARTPFSGAYPRCRQRQTGH